MMTTHTSLRAGTGTAAGITGQPGTNMPGIAAARGGDFLATLAAALSIESGTAVRPEGQSAEVTSDEAGQANAVDALIAALGPFVPVAPEAQPGAAGTEGDDGASPAAAAMPAPGRAAGIALSQLAEVLRDGAGAAVDGGSADNHAGNQSAARELSSHLLQTVAGPARELAPEFRLAGSTELITATSAQTLGSAAVNSQGTSTATAAEQALRTAVGSPRWAEELGSRLVLMSTRGHHEGSLTLSPEHLGPLEVRISVNQNTAQVWFGAQLADTRAALAEALPRLREMFAEAGMSLGQAGVSQEAPRREAPEIPEATAGTPAEREGAAPQEPAPLSISSALLDLYA